MKRRSSRKKRCVPQRSGAQSSEYYAREVIVPMGKIGDVDAIVSDKEEAALVLGGRSNMGPVCHAAVLVKSMMTQPIARREVPAGLPPIGTMSMTVP